MFEQYIKKNCTNRMRDVPSDVNIPHSIFCLYKKVFYNNLMIAQPFRADVFF